MRAPEGHNTSQVGFFELAETSATLTGADEDEDDEEDNAKPGGTSPDREPLREDAAGEDEEMILEEAAMMWAKRS